MNRSRIEQIADAVLYEGYILYPYRPSLKNRQRWTFGGVFPRAYSERHAGSDRCSIQTQCLIVANPATQLSVKLRFLHLMDRNVAEGHGPPFRPVASLNIDGKPYYSWQEAVERQFAYERVAVDGLISQPQRRTFSFPGSRHLEPLQNAAGETVGRLIREQQPLAGALELRAERLTDHLVRLTVIVRNASSLEDAGRTSRDDALLRSLVSAHILLHVRGGKFVSQTDPPEECREFSAGCENVGVWPVLVGEDGSRDAMLAAPIILYDYPQVAPESPGDFFDGTEIDEMLSLRILTLTDDEHAEMAGVDPRADALLQRTQALAREELLGLHGVLRPHPTEGRHA
jgi:hydrogenase maturation protease